MHSPVQTLVHLRRAAWLVVPLCAAGSALAADPPPPKLPQSAAAKPAQSSRTGPGTQTEDDLYVGTKRQVQGVNTPGIVLQVRPGAGTSPNTGATGRKTTSRSGGDDDLEDLEVERRKVQGVNTPGTTAPAPRPAPGVSPNTGRRIEAPRPLAPLPK